MACFLFLYIETKIAINIASEKYKDAPALAANNAKGENNTK